ncbi:MAG: hypothetical protein AAB605_00550 [Patescibacteria group bacterium]
MPESPDKKKRILNAFKDIPPTDELVESREPTPEELKQFKIAKQRVAKIYSYLSVSRDESVKEPVPRIVFAKGLLDRDSGKIQPLFGMYRRRENKIVLRDEKSEFARRELVHDMSHELLHSRTKTDFVAYSASNKDFVQGGGGVEIVRERVGGNRPEIKGYFSGLEEAFVEELNIQGGILDGSIDDELLDGIYIHYRHVLYMIIGLVKKNREKTNPDITCMDIWKEYARKFLIGDRSYLKEMEMVLNRGSIKALSRFGYSRHEDESIYGKLSEIFRSKYKPEDFSEGVKSTDSAENFLKSLQQIRDIMHSIRPKAGE